MRTTKNLDRPVVAFQRPLHGHLRGPAVPAQQLPHDLDGVAGVEHPPDQHLDTSACPPLGLLAPAVRERTALQLLFQALSLLRAEPLGPDAGP